MQDLLFPAALSCFKKDCYLCRVLTHKIHTVSLNISVAALATLGETMYTGQPVFCNTLFLSTAHKDFEI